jgi:dihydropteroate synthase
MSGVSPQLQESLPMSAEQHNVNSSMDRRREERERAGDLTEQFSQANQEIVHKVATNGLKIWQSYLDLGTSMAQSWVQNLQNVKSSLEQMTSSGQDQDQDQHRQNRRAS